MGKAKKTLLAAVAVVIGIVTLKKFRSSGEDAEPDVVDENA
jgi:hypothetical protein